MSRKGMEITTILLFALLLTQCRADAIVGSDELGYRSIQMECMDLVSTGGHLEVVIRDRVAYDSLFHARFQEPLDTYWNENYADVLASVRERYPGLSRAAYERRVRQAFYSVLPFRGTEGCTHPEIDFSRYTLLGQSARASGCEPPEIGIEVTEADETRYLFRLTIEEKGSCDRGFSKNIWILISKIPTSQNVQFEVVRR